MVLGYDNIAQYADSVNSPSDYGSSVGRYANRIKHGKLTVDGKVYQLPTNNFGHCLHGGPSGWMYQVYDVVTANDSRAAVGHNVARRRQRLSRHGKGNDDIQADGRQHARHNIRGDN